MRGRSRSPRGPRTDRRAGAACRCGGRGGSTCRRSASSRPAAARRTAAARRPGSSRPGDADAVRRHAARGDRREGPARRARGRARHSRSCGRRPAASRAPPWSPGTSPPCCSTTAVAMPTSDRDFGAEEAGGLDLRLELRGRRPRQRACVGVAAEERRRDLVDALVGALRRKDRRDEQLVGVREVELGVGVGMLPSSFARIRRVSAGVLTAPRADAAQRVSARRRLYRCTRSRIEPSHGSQRPPPVWRRITRAAARRAVDGGRAARSAPCCSPQPRGADDDGLADVHAEARVDQRSIRRPSTARECPSAAASCALFSMLRPAPLRRSARACCTSARVRSRVHWRVMRNLQRSASASCSRVMASRAPCRAATRLVRVRRSRRAAGTARDPVARLRRCLLHACRLRVSSTRSSCSSGPRKRGVGAVKLPR